MNKQVAHIVTLNSYARQGAYIHESWASTDFSATYAAAVDLCKDGIGAGTIGVDIDWSPNQPDTLRVCRRGIVSERIEFSRDLPLGAELGRTLLGDLQALAVQTAAAQIRAERDQALLNEASGRVAELLNSTLAAKGTEPA